MQLPDAAGDQLGELAAEIEHDHRIGLARVGAIAAAVVTARAGALSAVSRYASTSASSGARTRWPALAGSPWTVFPRSGGGGGAAPPVDGSWSASAVRSANPPSSFVGASLPAAAWTGTAESPPDGANPP